jgi:hypothetical protein
MGLFMQFGGILASESDSSEAVTSLKAAHPKTLENVGFYSEKDDRVLAFFDDYATGLDDVIAEISKHLQRPAFWFHIHDGDLWMYRLYHNGNEIDRFNTCPGYWSEVDSAVRKSWAGSATKVSEVWPGVAEPDIMRYLVDHEAEGFDGEMKAYESDEFPAWDCWQMVDFLAKLGLAYPPDEEG